MKVVPFAEINNSTLFVHNTGNKRDQKFRRTLTIIIWLDDIGVGLTITTQHWAFFLADKLELSTEYLHDQFFQPYRQHFLDFTLRVQYSDHKNLLESRRLNSFSGLRRKPPLETFHLRAFTDTIEWDNLLLALSAYEPHVDGLLTSTLVH